MKRIGLLILIITLSLFISGCKQDNMENIEIIVTNYPNEYITENIYGKHATISSIYPDGVNIDDYEITKKQKKDYAFKDLFIYNGQVEKERKLAVELLDLNPELKIIDAAYVLESDYSGEDLWLNPSSLLMMSNNVRMGLNEYITSSYLKKEVTDNYNELKIKLSELDADYRVAVEEADSNVILTTNPILKYLTTFGIDVLVISDNTSEKDLDNIIMKVRSGIVDHLYKFKSDKLSPTVDEFAKDYGLEVVDLNNTSNLTDDERDNNKNYIDIMQDNLNSLKLEMYQ